ncbi:class I tRNA ligase family protein [Symbioplanes lichenis]|uniref:class I tRNA ligase family protein n=1 Tax=Symbioplanes lichenis TaxID=1629072 RepID=UPI00273824F6|nr:class I tRNA ligase family protein [Actinoplanes lichenis]
MADSSGHVLVTCAPPNPNGDLHLGHLSGPFLGADVLRRHLASRGVRTSYVSYTDDHSCYVPRRAAELRWTARETAFRFTRRIEQTLALAGMSPDYYSHPHREPRHDATVQREFLRLRERGAVVERTMPTPYCQVCERFVYEAYLRGQCRFCDSPCDGTYCEECGYPQDPDGVREGKCITCGTEPVWRDSRRLVVPLNEFADRLARLYESAAWSRRVLDYCEKLLAMGLPDVPVSRVDGYGIAVPLAGWEGHVLDTWFSGIFGYIAATDGHQEALGHPDGGSRIWSDPGTTLVNFIGFDCSFSHAVLWPALLLALDRPVLPGHIVSNEFYYLEGEKFSTSRGHAIWGADFLNEMPADAVRFHLCLTRPETERTNFRRTDFVRTRREILAGLDDWAGGVVELLAATSGSVVPDVAPADHPSALRGLADHLRTETERALDPAQFSPRRAAAAVARTVEEAGAGIRSLRAGGSGDPTGTARALAAHAELLATLASVSAPLLPVWAGNLQRRWGLAEVAAHDTPRWPETGARLMPAGSPIPGVYEPAFGRP